MSAPPVPSGGVFARLASLLSVAAAFAALTAWSWLRWADVQVDFGVELYVPWRLASGDALYRDIATRNGPLSHHVNALLFLLFGPSVRVLVLANLAILAGICAMTWKLFRDACGVLTATACSLVLLAMFGFSQYTALGNFNYVTPYQHAQTHAIALSLAMILLLARGHRSGAPRDHALAGICLGLVLMTKAELIVPAAAAAAAAFALLRAARRPTARPLGAFLGSALAPTVAMLAYLAAQMPLATASQGLLGNFAHLSPALASDGFYLHTMGLDDAAANARTAVGAFVTIAAFVAASVAADALVPARFKAPPAIAATGVAFGVGGALLLALRVDWIALARALPLVTLATLVPLSVACVRALRRPGTDAPSDGGVPRELPLVTFSVFALALLGKIFLNARFGHYGFALAMPATLLLVATLTNLVPRSLTERRGGGPVYIALGTAAVAACVATMLGASNSHYAVKTLSIGSGPDRVLAEAPPHGRRAEIIALGLARLTERMAADATLVVFPEGVGLNYWLRRRNPSRYHLFLPSELDAFGADEMLRDLQAHAPDWVVLLHRDPTDFGAGRFGTTAATGQPFIEWFATEYERVERIGAEPFDRRPGLVILRRKEPGRATGAPGRG